MESEIRLPVLLDSLFANRANRDPLLCWCLRRFVQCQCRSQRIDAALSIVSTLLTRALQGWHSSAIDEREIEQMRVTVKKWGNSAAVRLPASVMQATQLELDDVVEVREDRGRIVIERVSPRKYELSELLNGITNKNQHRAIDFGPAVGGEIW